MEFAELLAQAKPAERTIRLCLRGDLVAEFEELDRKLTKAKAKTSSDSLAGSGAAGIATQMEALREQMDQASATFRLRALSRAKYQALTAKHPPRRDAEGKILPDDAEHDVDTTTFWSALARACLTEPVMDDAQWSLLVDEILSDRQFEQLAIAALSICRGNVDIPFSFAASELLPSSGGESNPLSD